MQAAYFKKPGDVANIIIGELPVPKIQPASVLLKVQAVSVNNVDLFVRSGAYQTPLVPNQLLGRDAVGVVQQVGEAVTGFAVGDLVWTNSMGYAGRNGVTAELIAVPAERIFHLPVGVDPIQAVATVHASATAAIILQRSQAGQSILITGAHGHVGQRLVEVAKAKGMVVSTTSNAHDFTELQALGADHCYAYGPNFSAALPGQYDHVIDTSGRVPLQTQIDLLADFGTITLITAPAAVAATFDQRQFYMADKQIQGFVISKASLAEIQQAGALLNQQFTQGKLLEKDVTVLPFSQARQAHERLAQQTEHRKMVLVPDALFNQLGVTK